MKLLFDIETNGLYHDLTVIHCIAILDLDTEEIHLFNDQGNQQSVTNAVTMLDGADLLVGHNIIYYDNPVLHKFFPFFTGHRKSIDTLLLSRLFCPNLMQLDCIQQPKDMPRRMYGRHSLEAWGLRLGEHKGEFAKKTDWQSWSPEMEEYCKQDLKVTHKLWTLFHQSCPGLP